MPRHFHLPGLLALAGLFALGYAIGCGGPNDDPSASEDSALLACHLTRATVGPGGHLHACDPQDVKKTTICHIPPGNPANAHTICVGNPAVPAHLANHGDYLGACQRETPCQPPTGSGGAPGGTGGAAGGGGQSTGGGGGQATGGSGGGGVVPVVP